MATNELNTWTLRVINDQGFSFIKQLNTEFDLNIPHSHDAEPTRVKPESCRLELHCLAKIDSLYRQTSNLDGVLDNFREQARTCISNWTLKPKQERGTLPRKITKPFLHQDRLSRSDGKLTSQERQKLLIILDDLLLEECRLFSMSEDYQHVSSQQHAASHTSSQSSSDLSFGTARSGSPSRTETRLQLGPANASNSGKSRTRMETAKKRGSISQENASPKKQRKITDAFVSKWNLSPSNPTTSSLPLPVGLITSFDTVSSQKTDRIFSENEDDDTTSTETSILSEHGQQSQDYFPTQEAEEYLKDESFVSDLDIADSLVSPSLSLSLDNLAGSGPFSENVLWPVKLPFWQKFEIHRLALRTGQSLSKLFTAFLVGNDSYPPDQSFEKRFCGLAKSLNLNGDLYRCDIRDWTRTSGVYEDSKKWESTYFVGKLEFAVEEPDRLFTATLEPVRIDRSCRFHRRFGADRFLTLFMPDLTTEKLPPTIRRHFEDNENRLHEAVCTWLSTSDLHIAGRRWRTFYIEADKSKSKTKRDRVGSCHKAHLFAVDGHDFDTASMGRKHIPISLLDFTNWHVPLDENLDSTDLKLFSRFSLGLSKTIPTIELRCSEFLQVEAPSEGSKDMSDGCAKMSLQLAKAIWTECGDGTCDLPSAFQGRIGGAKGLWLVDYAGTRDSPSERGFWIEVAESQLKIKPHPRRRITDDPSHRTFEVLKYSKPCATAGLNLQLISILEDRGVPRTVMKEALLSEVRGYIDEAKDSMADPVRLRGWLQKYHGPGSDRVDLSFAGGLPNSKEAEVALLIESGFAVESCLRLRKSIRKLMTRELDKYVDKLRIGLPHSTNVFCAPDPYGVLAPNEVYLGFSTEWKNPINGLPEHCLDNIDVLVARNPAHLASDIQKRRAVYKRELRHFKNVILFSSKGNTPLASLLSGGDYDGDTVFVTWDPLFTAPFQNICKPDLPEEGDCGMVQVSRKLLTYFKKGLLEQELVSFYKSCFLFNTLPNFLGLCTSELEMIVYNVMSLDDFRVKILAALAGYLVDCNKQGWLLSASNWKNIRRPFNTRLFVRPQYKAQGDRPRRNGEHCVNIIDHLKFDVAQKEKDKVLKEFEGMFSVNDEYDVNICTVFKAEERRVQDCHDPQRQAVGDLLTDLKIKLESFVVQWSKDCRGLDEEAKSTQFAIIAEQNNQRLQKIEPCRVKCDIVRDFDREGCARGSRWSLLRASALYFWHWKRSTAVWHTAGSELCRLKARSWGETREILPHIYSVLKPDLKRIERLSNPASNDVDADTDDLDEFFDMTE